MSKYTKKILDLIAQKPGIRTVEIAEEVDCDVDHVDFAIAGQLKHREVIAEQIMAPNGRPQNKYRMAEVQKGQHSDNVEPAYCIPTFEDLRRESVNALWSE